MLFKTVIPCTKKLKGKAVLNLEQYCVHSFLINAYEDMYPLLKQEAAKKARQLWGMFVLIVV